MTTCVDGDLPRHNLSPVHGDGVHGGGCGNTQITFIMTMVAMPVMMMIQVYKMHFWANRFPPTYLICIIYLLSIIFKSSFWHIFFGLGVKSRLSYI